MACILQPWAGLRVTLFGGFDPVSAVDLGTIECIIGQFYEAVHCRAAGRRKPGHAYADSQGKLGHRTAESVCLYRGTHPVGHKCRLFERSIRQNCNELITSVTGSGVIGAKFLLKQQGNLLQDTITLQVTIGIVYLFEVVDIQDNQGQVALLAQVALNLFTQSLHKVAPVEKPGQVIRIGQFQQQLIGPLETILQVFDLEVDLTRATSSSASNGLVM
jgi:hypothetical protein